YIAVETLKKIKERYDLDFIVVDFIGKKWMCLIPGVDKISTRDFTEFCRDLKKDEKCPFYNNVRKGGVLTKEARRLIEKIKDSLLHNEELCDLCARKELCPYEIACELGKCAKVIICDYYHVFNPNIRMAFFSKNKKTISSSILIVDEAHSLADRIREILTYRITDASLSRAVREARKFKYLEESRNIEWMIDVLKELEEKLLQNKDEAYVKREEFIDAVEDKTQENFNDLQANFEKIGDEVREKAKKSYIGSLAMFMESWLSEHEGYVRIIKRVSGEFKKLTLMHKCLDPSISSFEVFSDAHSSILMSGTLTPTEMYRDILGLEKERTLQVEYASPFPKENRLVLIVPETTTKYKRRSEQEYKRIAVYCADISNAVPGNVAIFFPSYEVRDHVLNAFKTLSKKPLLIERQGSSKRERAELYHQFKENSEKGSVLLGVSGSSFSEGVDYPGKFLRCVIVVGVPLEKPDLEMQALIEYYDKKFNAGWNYGYIFPAMIRAIQAAGRCIRSEEDRGACVFLDERFIWANYFKCLPKDWKVLITKNPKQQIREFFKNEDQRKAGDKERSS
ncbi:MAG: ATP-dependent DNA helicase, partial [Candidatus Nanoarchaeia archaeon]|nr:ATP-dependent DNA helicase [Candidatus Jingweiarchaeum tengchongense]